MVLKSKIFEPLTPLLKLLGGYIHYLERYHRSSIVSQPKMSDISSLRQSFKGDIVTPADPDYKDAIARWAANTERPARVVAFIKDTTDVSLALRYARDNNLQVAIRCGGHSGSGASSAKDGLVIDLSRYFNYAVADPEKRTMRVGGGALWDTVESESAKHELATVAGTVSHVRKVL